MCLLCGLNQKEVTILKTSPSCVSTDPSCDSWLCHYRVPMGCGKHIESCEMIITNSFFRPRKLRTQPWNSE